jgi:hypothetical protein
MATQHDATQHPSPSAPVTIGKLVEYDQFIEAQLRKTRSQVRAVDITGNLMILAGGALVFFLAAAVVDHWVVTGGLGFWGRLALFFVLVVSMLAYLITQVLPLVLRRINPLYAAQTIERSRPTLKNALVNFLFFRADPTGLPGRVYEAIEEQAATNLAKVHVEATVDRTKLVRTGYALVAVVALAAVYMFLSPKNLLMSAGRIVMPWADIDPPTSTAIVEIAPGDVQAFRGQQVAVSARIQGLPKDGKVLLRYTSADGQVVDRPVEMTLDRDGYKHACSLPGGDALLQQDLEYRIEAGDARSRPFRIQVVAAPTIVVRSINYHYPKYAGLLDSHVENQGDIRALEGTEVTLEALANQDIQSAHIDFDCDARQDLPMRAEGQGATISFRLGMKEDRQTPEHTSYQLVFKNAAGQQNPQPVRHQIEVIRDLPPEIRIAAPSKEDLELPLDAATQIEVVANDPDFALALVKLSATVGGAPLVDQLLLNEVRSGQFVRKFRFEPRKHKLKVGDVVEYWATAEDSKQPMPNRVDTAKRRLRIVSPDAKGSDQNQVARNDHPRDVERPPRGDDKSDGDGKQSRPNQAPPRQDHKQDEKSKPDQGAGTAQDSKDQQPSDDQSRDGDAGQNGQQQDKQSGESAGRQQRGQNSPSGQEPAHEENVPSDGTDDGDAIERILKHRDEQQKSGDKSKSEQDQSGGKNQSRDQQGSEKQQPSGKQDSREQGNEGAGDDPQQSERSGEKKQPRNDPRSRDDKQPQSRDSQQSDGGKSKPESRQQPSDKNDQRGDSKDGGSESKDEPGSEGKQASKQQSGKDKSGKSQDQQGSKGSEQGDKGNQSGQKSRSPEKGQLGQKGQPGQEGEQTQEPASDENQAAKSEPGGKSSSSKSADPQGSQDSQGDPGDAKPTASKPDKSSAPNAKSNDKQQAPGGEKPTSDDAKGDQPSDEKNGQSQAKDEPRAGESRQDGTPDKGAQRKPTEGQGAQSKSDPTDAKNREQSGGEQKPDAKGGDPVNNKGNSGAGQSTKDTKGSPSPTTESKPIDKPARESKDDESNKSEDPAHSMADDRRESDSEGQDSGDQSGGGKRGGGQKANKPGTGGPGQNTAADEGAGQSDESGDGDTADRAGDKQQADKSTGKSGSKSGDGTRKSASDKAGKPGAGESSRDPAEKSTPDPSSQSPPSSSPMAPGGTGQPQGGKPGGAPQDQKFKPTEDHADEANLEYARKATDLAIAHLKDELRKGRPDAELLDRLGWTAKDLENFVKRWEQMRAQARQPGEKGTAAKRELDQALKSLGLRPRAATVKHGAARDDQSRGLKESRRTTPPAEYAEQSKAYSQGTARGEK